MLEAQNDDKLEDDEDPSVSGEKERLAEENEGALSDEATADGNVKDPVDTEQVIMPAMSFNDSIKVSTGKPAGIDENAGSFLANAAESLPEEAEVSVRVEADEGTFPAGTTMVLSAVDQSSYDTLAETLAETVESRETSDTDISDTDTSEAKANTQQAETDNAEDQEIKQNTEQNNADNNTNIKTYGFQAVDITFFDKDGNEIEPAKPVRVALTSKVVEQAREKAEESAIADPVVVHVDNEGKAEQMDLVSPEEVEPAKGRSEEEMLEEAEKTAESGKTDNADDDISADDASGKKDVEHKADSVDESASAVSMDTDEAEESSTEGITAQEDRTVEEDGENRGKSEFTADSFSVYAIVYTVELYTNIITDSGETYRISVTYDETSGIPQDAELKVKEIKEGDKGYEDYYTEAVKAASESSDAQKDASNNNASGKDNKRVNPNKTYARFFDIEIWANGEKIEPARDVSVSIRLLDVPERDDRNVIKVVHFDQDDIEIIPHTAAADHTEGVDTTKDRDDKQAENNVRSEMEFNFTASSFSVYSVVSYTVDFHWEVDGEEYTFSISGGSAIAFSDLLPIIGVVEDDPETEVNEVKEFIENVQSVSFSNPELLSVSKVENNTTVGEIKDRLGLECEYSTDLTEEQIDEINTTKLQAGDWALISLKSFDTDEWLTVDLKDNQTFRIRVTDPVSDTAPGSMQTLTTEDTRSDGIKMWLFDYDNDHNLDNKNNTATATSSTYYTDGINSYSDFKFLGWGASNQDETNRDCLNDFTGLDDTNGNKIRALQGIVKNTLVNGYPVLNDNHMTNGVNQSLAYLFDPTLGTSDRTVYGGTSKDDGNVTKLFRKENGYYIYDSDEHYAELQNDGKTFTVYTSTLAQTDNSGNNHNPSRAVGFFPFDTYAHVYNDLKYENDNNKYGNYGTLYLNPDERITGWGYGYPITQAGPSGLNHHLGVAMEMNFEIPAGGKIGDKPIKFNFSGDDDMWVFIDDQLVLDIGGLHQPVDGTIDFSTGLATITGKATQAGHSDNTGNAAIVTVEGANDPRGNDFSFYPALGLTGGDGKIHTMKIFYLERGGCDSNCMISFNLPLVVVKKNSQLTKVKEDRSPLPGAEFTVFEDLACTIPLTVAGKPVKAVSGSDGSVVINDIPYKKEELKTKVYYMKETSIPNEYADNSDVYILHYNADQDRVNIKKLNADGTEETLPNSQIINKKMSLVVKKEWLNEDGSEMNPKPTTPVTFNIKRYKTYVPKPDTSNMREVSLSFQKFGNQHGNWPMVTTTVNARPGDIVTVTIQDTDSNWTTFNSGGNSDATFTASNGTATFDITMNEKISWQFESHNYNKPPTNTATISAVNKTYEAEEQQERDPVTVLDTSFNQTLTLPTTPGGAWIDTVSNLPAQELKPDGIQYFYQYYAEETIPEGYKVIYYDKDGNEIDYSDLSSLKTDVPGSEQLIKNQKYPHVNIPAEKHWDDFAGDNYYWTAKLQLDYRDIPVPSTGVDVNAIPWQDYHSREPAYCKEINKDSPTTEFDNLPIKIMKNDGKEYRREYSIKEIAYKVTRLSDDRVVFEYDYDTGVVVPQGDTYTPWYDHDAGEDDDYDDTEYPGVDDYNIEVHNLRENRNIQKKINLTIEKEWSDPSYESNPDAKAKFKLKRYILTEYRNYEGTTFASAPKVTLKLQDTSGSTIEELKVPQGVRMSIHGYLKPGANGNIVFDNGLSYQASNPTSDQVAFDIGFTANGQTIKLQSGAENVVGGESGLRFKELEGSAQTVELDTSFCIEFELYNGHWRKTFPETHGGGDHHESTDILPAVEVSILDADGNTANTYVYRYFFEEVECTPDSFSATFTTTGESGSEELLGDKEHQIYFDSDITATNRPTGLDILKVDMDHPENVLSGAQFTMRKLDEDSVTGLPYKVSSGGEYVVAATISSNLDATDSDGKLIFTPNSGLTPGYYEVKETMSPTGYVLLEDPKFYIKVEKLGVIKLAGKNQDGTVNWPGDDDEGVQAIGNVSIASSTTAEDGKTITVTVRNEPGAALPSAGGFGTDPFYFLGTVLLVIAGMMYYIRWYRAKQSQNAA